MITDVVKNELFKSALSSDAIIIYQMTIIYIIPIKYQL